MTYVCPSCEGSGEYQPTRDPQHVIVCSRCQGRGEVNFIDENEDNPVAYYFLQPVGFLPPLIDEGEVA